MRVDRRSLFFAIWLVISSTAFSALYCGCSALPAAKGDLTPMTNAVAALAAHVQDVRSQIGDVKATTATIDSRVQDFDDWTIRIMAAGPYLVVALCCVVAFSYIVAKGGWHGVAWIFRSMSGSKTGARNKS